jgi:hypothetical protein
MAELRTRPRFPEVPLDDGHYESFYIKASHPAEPLGVWIRHTVHKRPGARPRASLWFTLFDAAADGPAALKTTVEADDLGTGPDHYIAIADSRLEPGRAVGSAAAGGREASWLLEFSSDEPPLHHLPRDWMYRASIPRTKLLSPYPGARFRGYVKLGDRRVAVDDWPGMVGHNWGAQHAERWIWLHGTDFDGADGAWLDAAIGRIKLGPLTSPWIANGVLSLEGERHRLGGAERVRGTKIDEAPDHCEFTFPGKGVSVRGRVGSERSNFVGWVYADPDGSEHNTVNCSIASMTLTVSVDGRERVLETRSGAAYELGMRETDHGIPIQPFPDG